MSEFKFACPVCGQHIQVESWRSNTVMECPTCFQKITVPLAPVVEDSKFILAGTKAGGERPIPLAADAGEEAPEKQFPVAVFAVVLLLCAAAVAVFVFRGKIFKSAGQAPTASVETHTPVLPPGVEMPSADSTNWTLNLDKVTIPDTPAVGYIHGKVLIPEKMILNSDGLTIRTAAYPPVAGVTIYLRPKPVESVYGKSVFIKANATNAPAVYLRFRDEEGREKMQSETNGYAMRLEFGQPDGERLPGKIYLCTPDEMKSWLVGVFNAEYPKPRPQ